MSKIRNREFRTFSRLTGNWATQKLNNFCSSSLWICLHHMVILRSQNITTNRFMILAWLCRFKWPSCNVLLTYSSIGNYLVELRAKSSRIQNGYNWPSSNAEPARQEACQWASFLGIILWDSFICSSTCGKIVRTHGVHSYSDSTHSPLLKSTITCTDLTLLLQGWLPSNGLSVIDKTKYLTKLMDKM